MFFIFTLNGRAHFIALRSLLVENLLCPIINDPSQLVVLYSILHIDLVFNLGDLLVDEVGGAILVRLV